MLLLPLDLLILAKLLLGPVLLGPKSYKAPEDISAFRRDCVISNAVKPCGTRFSPLSA